MRNIFLRKKNKNENEAWTRNDAMLLEQSIAHFNGTLTRIRPFSTQELVKATGNYDTNNIFHKHVEYTLYEGQLESVQILVKKFKRVAALDMVIKDIVVSSRMSAHNRVTRLSGCCLETEPPTLVFEFDQNQTLAHCLYGSRGTSWQPLSWKCRLRIAADIANALGYLHTALPRPIIHRDIKDQNILLDRHNVAKLTDFSRCIAIPEGKTRVHAGLRGTKGFVAPEFFRGGYVSEKSDVFSFGVFLFVLLTGRRLTDLRYMFQEWDDGQIYENDLPTYVKYHVENNRMNEVIDAAILTEEGWPGKEQQLKDFVSLGLSCVVEADEERPEMMEVEHKLRLLEELAP